MKTIRKNVFETNSSSTHSLTIKELRIGSRDISEFPLPNEFGTLTVDINTTGDESKYSTFNDYLCLAISWLVANQSPDSSLDASATKLDNVSEYGRFMQWINAVYRLMHLPKVNRVIVKTSLTLDINKSYCIPSYGIGWDNSMLNYDTFDDFLECTASVRVSELTNLGFYSIISEDEYRTDIPLYLSAATMTMSCESAVFEI